MSAATMNGSDAVKATSSASSAASSKQQVKGGSSSEKALEGARKQAASPLDSQNKKQPTTQPRAWQGPNPITQRASASTPNGTHSTTPKPQTHSQQKSNIESNTERQAHDRALFLLASFTGHDATVTLQSGEQFTGVFSGANLDTPKQTYLLKMVRRTRGATHQQVNGNVEMASEYIGEGDEHAMAFDKEDIVELHVPDVAPLSAAPVQNGTISSTFRTDTEISARDASHPHQRELQRWDAGADSSIDMSLEASGASGWDQFAVNERMYGVSSTYDENIYTTQINRDDPRYRQREAEAARIAREIEGSTASNAHVAEERRTNATHGDGLDEEEKYSGVQRDTSALPRRAAGSYVPPSRRPLTNAPTVPGAPFDPAIISLAKPTSSAQAAQANAPAQTPEPSTMPRTPEAIPQTHGTQIAAASGQTRLGDSTNTTEEHVRNVTDSFKLFANNEKLRIKQAQEKHRSAARATVQAEKEIKLNDLKKFSENFTLKSRVPDDLVPILAKDRDKQVEIQEKAEKAAEKEASRRVEWEKQKAAGATSPALSSTASQPGNAASHPASTPLHAATTMSATQPQSSRARAIQNMRGAPFSGPMQSPARAPASQQNRSYGRQGFPPPPQPLPANLRIPPAPAAASVDAGPLSPTKALNAGAKAFEFRPAANAFTPTGVSPSPQRSPGKADAAAATPAATEVVDFFKNKKTVDGKSKRDFMQSSNPIKRMLEAEYPEDQKKAFASNGGIPQPYRTPPTWPCEDKNVNTSYTDSIPKPPQSQPHSQMHTPNQSTSQMPHAHQIPPHMHGPGGQPPTPSQRMPFIPPQHHSHPQSYGPGMPHLGPNGSVQNSPRFQQPQMAFNGQMQNMPMPQFAGQQMQGYQMSPNMQYRQMNMPPNGPMMMHPGQGQMPSQGYQRGGPNPAYNQQQMMPGMMPNGPNGANFMNGPMPGQHPQHPQQQGYSPMPPHAQPQMHQQGYAGSPRPGHMMQHTSSHQGFQPNQQHMGMMPGMNMGGGMGPGGPQQQPHFAQTPGGPHPHHLQYRQMSQGAYPQMTPRQGHAAPAMGPSPGQGMGGEEGKGG